jgi:hypothetical protein
MPILSRKVGRGGERAYWGFLQTINSGFSITASAGLAPHCERWPTTGDESDRRQLQALATMDAEMRQHDRDEDVGCKNRATNDGGSTQ